MVFNVFHGIYECIFIFLEYYTQKPIEVIKNPYKKKTFISHVIPHILSHDCEPCEEFHIFISQMGVF